MSVSTVDSNTERHTGQTVLSKVVIAGLLGNVLVNAILQVLVVRSLIVPLTIILVLTVVVAGVVATRWRWAPLLAALWCILAIIPGLAPYSYNLMHPAEIGDFIATVLGLASYLTAIVAGLAATFAVDRRATADRAPGWLYGFLIGVSTFSLGVSLVSLIPSSNSNATAIRAEELAQLPALVATQTKFDQTELRAKVGETVALRLDNRDAERHYFDIDELDIHVPMPAGTSAVALFRPTKPGTYIYYCQVPGHREAGMVGTLIVEP